MGVSIEVRSHCRSSNPDRTGVQVDGGGRLNREKRGFDVSNLGPRGLYKTRLSPGSHHRYKLRKRCASWGVATFFK